MERHLFERHQLSHVEIQCWGGVLSMERHLFERHQLERQPLEGVMCWSRDIHRSVIRLNDIGWSGIR